MEKIEKIKSNIEAHQKELDRINSLPDETKALKYVKLQKLSLEKAIQKLSGKIQKLGGSLEDLGKTKKFKQSEDIEVVDVVKVTTAQKKKKGSKKK